MTTEHHTHTDTETHAHTHTQCLTVGHKHTCEDGYSSQILRQTSDSVYWRPGRRKQPTEWEEETTRQRGLPRADMPLPRLVSWQLRLQAPTACAGLIQNAKEKGKSIGPLQHPNLPIKEEEW